MLPRRGWHLPHRLHSLILPPTQHHSFTTTSTQHEKPLPPRRPLPKHEYTETFLKGSGPGGQKINKTSSAVQLKHLPTGIVVKCQGTRSREQNRKDARKLLGERLEGLELGDQARGALKVERMRVKKASGAKKRRRKYRALEGGKEGVDGLEEGVEEGVEGDEAVDDVGKTREGALEKEEDVVEGDSASKESK